MQHFEAALAILADVGRSGAAVSSDRSQRRSARRAEGSNSDANLARSACVECRKSKIACVLATDGGAEAVYQCQRCRRLGLSCTAQLARQKKGPKPGSRSAPTASNTLPAGDTRCGVFKLISFLRVPSTFQIT